MRHLSQRTDSSLHKNYKIVPILVTLPAAMKMYQVRRCLQKGLIWLTVWEYDPIIMEKAW